MSPKKKDKVIERNEETPAEDPQVSSGSIPDPESLDFEEYEDEDAGSVNENGEQNEEPIVPGAGNKANESESNY